MLRIDMSDAVTEIVLASRNRKKVLELEQLLSPRGIVVRSVSDFPDVPDIVEDGETFAENAAKKAVETARLLNRWTLGEDSGLVVDALGGAPGVYSARYAGEECDDDANNRKLITQLQGVAAADRGAGYVCHVAVADPGGAIRLRADGQCRGRISAAPRGENGFGYDPFFLIAEYHRTFGELGPAVKRQISHRARALAKLIPPLVRLLCEPGT